MRARIAVRMDSAVRSHVRCCFEPLAGLLRHGAVLLGIGEQGEDTLGVVGGGSIGVEEHASLVVADDRRYGLHGARDGWETEGLGLGEDDAEALGEGGDEEEVRTEEEFGELRALFGVALV